MKGPEFSLYVTKSLSLKVAVMYMLLVDLGRMAIYLQGAGSTCDYLQGFGEQAHNLRI